MMLLARIYLWIKWIVLVPVHIVRFVLRVIEAVGTFIWRVILGIGLPALRFLAYIFVLVAVIALTADATPPLSGVGPFRPTLFSEHWSGLAPSSLAAARETVVAQAGSWLWDYAIAPVINLPTFIIFGGLGGMAAFAGRRRLRTQVFAN